MLTRTSNFWITHINDSTVFTSSSYVVHSHCPVDYCLMNVPVNLNYFNGSDDSQCDKGRSENCVELVNQVSVCHSEALHAYSVLQHGTRHFGILLRSPLPL